MKGQLHLRHTNIANFIIKSISFKFYYLLIKRFLHQDNFFELSFLIRFPYQLNNKHRFVTWQIGSTLIMALRNEIAFRLFNKD